jgi:hypothetical protein
MTDLATNIAAILPGVAFIVALCVAVAWVTAGTVRVADGWVRS